MKKIETSGKTVEAAVKNGLLELGCDASDVDIEILEMGSPGLFGMFGKLAKVRLTVKEKEDDFKIDMPQFSLETDKKQPKAEAPKPAAKSAPKAAPVEKKPAEKAKSVQAVPAEEQKADKAEPVAEEKKPEKKAEKQDNADNQTEKPARPRRRDNRRREKPLPEDVNIEAAPVEEHKPFVPAAEDTWSEPAQKAVEFVRNTTKMMGVDVTVEVCEEEDTVHIRMNGDTLGILIGRRGETLDALQYLTSLYVNKNNDEYIRISLDSENYRAKREEALRKLAVRMAQRACKTGRRVVLEPMNPYERRIMHSALQGNTLVQTHSEGDDPYRRVIITLR